MSKSYTPIESPTPLHEMFNIQRSGPLWYLVCHLPLFGDDPQEARSQKLISEYCAIDEMDRIFRGAAPESETELIGLKARKIRRREILLEFAARMSIAETR